MVINNQQKNALIAAIEKAIWKTHHSTLPSSKTGQIREEYYVASLVQNGPNIIKGKWQPILNKMSLNVNVAGAFCHGRPQVKWTDGVVTGHVELV